MPDWSLYNEDDEDSKANIDGIKKYWDVENNLGGGALWYNLALGNDKYTG
jgi:hypothetical protein